MLRIISTLYNNSSVSDVKLRRYKTILGRCVIIASIWSLSGHLETLHYTSQRHTLYDLNCVVVRVEVILKVHILTLLRESHILY